MANLGQLIPALFTGKGGELLTPEQIKRRQDLANSAMAFATDSSPNAGGVASILAKGLAGFRAGYENNRAEAGIQAAAKENQSLISNLLSGLGGTGGISQGATVSSPTVAPVQSPSVSPVTSSGSDPVAEVLADPNTTPAEKSAQIEYIRYANQGATRNQPINENLQNALAFLPELGITAEVFSGGQPAKGSGLARVGSVRHDDGNAADVFFYKDGRRLDWGNENDRPIFEEIVRRGKDSGITGFGAGPGYMQQGSMHIGFGSPGVWGAGGRGANAPDWLRAAYGSGNVSQPSTSQRAPVPTYDQASASAGITPAINPAIVAALSSPVANAQTQNVAGLLLNQQFSQQEAARQAALAQQQQQQALAQRQSIAQSMGIDPSVAMDDNAWKAAVEAANRGRQTATVNGTVIDVNTGQPIYTGAQQPTTGMQDYQFYADRETAAGRTPLGPLEYEQALRSSGAARTNIDTGTVPQGYQAVRDEQGRLVRYEPVPGGPADTTKLNEKAAVNTQRSVNIVLEDVDRAVSAIENNPTLTTGIIGNWSKGVGGTPANKVNNLLQTIRANSAFDRLQQMREASPTGGALGAVSDSELGLLQNAIGSLEQSNDSEDLVYNLRRVQRIYEDIINGPEGAKRLREERAKGIKPPENPLPEQNTGWRDAGNGIRIRPKGGN